MKNRKQENALDDNIKPLPNHLPDLPVDEDQADKTKGGEARSTSMQMLFCDGSVRTVS